MPRLLAFENKSHILLQKALNCYFCFVLWLIQIGFLNITLWDVLDILIVGYMLYRLYKLLKGSLGLNIVLGLVFVYVAWWLVQALEMPLLSTILREFINVGMIALIVLFQPEVRRFLLFLGQEIFKRRSNFLNRLFRRELEDSQDREKSLRYILKAIEQMAKERTGALMIFSDNPNLEGMYSSGVTLNADVSTQLIISIFNKESPLHDGATLISDGKIRAASCVLPVSENPSIPQSAGLRHRAGVGITEGTNVVSFIVSEETGKVSFAREGQLTQGLSIDKVDKILRRVLELRSARD